MNRLNYNTEKEYTEEVWDDGIKDLLPIIVKKTQKILVCDFDSLIYWTLVEKNEDGSPKELIEEDLPYLEGKLHEMVLGIFNKIETHFTLEKIYVFIRGDNNYRKSLYKEYKSNRKEKHPLCNNLYTYLINTFNAIPVKGYEAEDACATFAWKLKENCIVAYCDHDLLEIDSAIMYNYQRNKWRIQSEKDALWEKYKKLNIGEHGDFANFTPQYGIKKFEEQFHKDMTIEEYEKQSFETYLWCWSDKIKVKNKIQRTPNVEKATEMFNLAKEILWLKEVEI